MNEEMYMAECDPSCGFAVQSHNKKEVMGMVKTHGKQAHKVEMSDASIRKNIKEVSAQCCC